jgi:periplasmic protein TonB
MQTTMRLVEGYNPPSRLQPGSLGLTVLFSGMFVSGLFFLNPKVIPVLPGAIKTITVALDPPPPPPERPVEHKQMPPQETLYVPPTPPEIVIPKEPEITFVKTPPVDVTPGEGNGAGIPVAKPQPSVMVGPSVDPHYAGYFQPPYPADEIRAGNAGRVSVRVLIGVDGRVKDIEKVSAASDSFWDATRRQALSKWRFKPATRDGVPYETWKTMNVSFVLNGDE